MASKQKFEILIKKGSWNEAQGWAKAKKGSIPTIAEIKNLKVLQEKTFWTSNEHGEFYAWSYCQNKEVQRVLKSEKLSIVIFLS